MSAFHVYVQTSKVPTTADLARVLSSRGPAVLIETEDAIHQVSGALPLKVDGKPMPVTVQVAGPDAVAKARAQAQADARSDVVGALRKADACITVQSDDEESVRWCRDLARALALMTPGVYQDTGSGKTIQFG